MIDFSCACDCKTQPPGSGSGIGPNECPPLPHRMYAEFKNFDKPYPTDFGVPWRNDTPYLCLGNQTTGWGCDIISGPQLVNTPWFPGPVYVESHVNIGFLPVALFDQGPGCKICSSQFTIGGYWKYTQPGPFFGAIQLICIGSGTVYHRFCFGDSWDCSPSAQEYSCNVQYLPSVFAKNSNHFVWKQGDGSWPFCQTNPIQATGVEVHFHP